MLNDKTIIVTGAASGIGAATAELAASQGASVILRSRLQGYSANGSGAALMRSMTSSIDSNSRKGSTGPKISSDSMRAVSGRRSASERSRRRPGHGLRAR